MHNTYDDIFYDKNNEIDNDRDSYSKKGRNFYTDNDRNPFSSSSDRDSKEDESSREKYAPDHNNVTSDKQLGLKLQVLVVVVCALLSSLALVVGYLMLCPRRRTRGKCNNDLHTHFSANNCRTKNVSDLFDLQKYVEQISGSSQFRK